MGIDMTENSITKSILIFSIPIFVGNILQNLYNVVDAVIVGRVIGKEALAIVSNIYIPMLLVNSIIMGGASGITIIVSHKYGEKDFEAVGKIGKATLLFALFLTSILLSYSFLISKHIFEWMKVPTELKDEIAAYFRVLSFGFPFVVAYNFISSIQKGIGESKTSLYALLFSSIVNIMLDLIFIVKLKLGIMGAAYGTIIAQCFSAIYMIITYFKHKKVLDIQLVKSSFTEQMYTIYLIVITGITSTVQNSFSALSMIIIQSIINTFGINAISAFSVAYKIESILTIPAVSLGSTLCVFVGQNVGAKKEYRIRQALKKIIHISVILFFLVNSIIWIGGEKLVYLIVGNEPQVIFLANYYLKIFGLFYLFLIMLYLLTNYLRGLGEIVYPVFNTLLELSLRIVLVVIMSKYLGVVGIFYARPLSFVISYISLQMRSFWRKIKNEKY